MDWGILLWVVFHAVVFGMLALDLGVLNRKAHVLSPREAATWSVAWVMLALLFNAGIWGARGSEDGLAFLTGYVIEKSLSVDNIFVFLMIFRYFAVPLHLQPKVLKWGVLGALVMRAALIVFGAALIQRFHWVLYVFGAFLVLTGIRMLVQRDEELHPERNPVLRFLRRHVAVTNDYVGDAFVVRQKEILYATPLLLTLVLVEFTDLVFAVDSIPAIFAVTTDPFLVYTSNVFAIMGLRALFFLVAGVIDLFRYLKIGLAVVLTFVGVKMLLLEVYKIPTLASLGVVVVILSSSVIVSLLHARQERARPVSPAAGHGEPGFETYH